MDLDCQAFVLRLFHWFHRAETKLAFPTLPNELELVVKVAIARLTAKERSVLSADRFCTTVAGSEGFGLCVEGFAQENDISREAGERTYLFHPARNKQEVMSAKRVLREILSRDAALRRYVHCVLNPRLAALQTAESLIPIEELRLPYRVNDILRENAILNVADLVYRSPYLLKTRGLGRKSSDLIIRRLKWKGFSRRKMLRSVPFHLLPSLAT